MEIIHNINTDFLDDWLLQQGCIFDTNPWCEELSVLQHWEEDPLKFFFDMFVLIYIYLANLFSALKG